jgi:F-type H+-transporting ATPase subunit a
MPQQPPPPETLDIGKVIIDHVSNSSPDHPLIHLPPVFGIDLSVSKHVFMLWLVAGLIFIVVTTLVRRYLAQPKMVPTGPTNALEAVVEFIRDDVVKPNVGAKRVLGWTPLLLTLALFIFCANAIGLVPIFDTLALIDHYVLHTGDHSFLNRVIHGGATATGNFNVTAGLATVTFMAIIVAGAKTHGVVGHFKNLIPPGVPWPLYFLLVPLEVLSMFVRPFALTMRLAANMTGGHIALLAILSFVFIFAELAGSSVVGMATGFLFSVPLATAISMLEIIVVLVQAYVFMLLSAVFIGMAIHAHH